MEPKGNINNELKEISEPKDCLKLQINLGDEKYFLKIFLSKDNLSIIFVLEKEKINTYYYYGKFYLNELKKINKKFNSDNNIVLAFNRLKDITQNTTCKLEKESLKMKIYFLKNNSEFTTIFLLRKKIVDQKRLNLLLEEEIQENKSKIKNLKKQVTKLDKIIENKNGLIDKIDDNISKLKNEINELNNNLTNELKNDKNKIGNELFKKEIQNKRKKLKEDLMKKKIQKNEVEKVKKEYKINLQKDKNKDKDANQELNLQDTIFNFGNIEVIKNKKIYEALITFNLITVVIIIYLLLSISDLNSSLTLKMKGQDLLKKIAILNLLENYQDDEMGGIRENIIDFQLKNNNNDNYQSIDNEEDPMNPKKKLTYIIKRKSKKKTLLYSEREKRFFRKHIKKKTHYRTRDIDFELIYNSFEPSRYNNLYYSQSVNKNFDILIIMKNKNEKRYALFTNNNSLQGRKGSVKGGDYVGYEFIEGRIIENSLKSFYDKHFDYIQNIFVFLQNEKTNLINGLNNTSTYLLGDLDLFEIYLVNYLK